MGLRLASELLTAENAELTERMLTRTCLERVDGRDVPAFGEKLFDGSLLNTFLDAEFVIEEVIGEISSFEVVDADAIAIAIGADLAYC